MKKLGLKRFRYYALIALGLALAYLATCVWWHRGGGLSVFELSYINSKLDPFALPDRPIFQRISHSGNRIFFDIEPHFDRLAGPFRKRPDPDGNPYFANNLKGDQWFLAGTLRCLGEKSLFSQSSNDQLSSFRILAYPDGGRPYVYHLKLKEGESTGFLRVAHLDRNSGKLTDDARIPVPAKSANNFFTLANQPEFWRTLTEEEKTAMLASHNSTFVVERLNGSSYDAVILSNLDSWGWIHSDFGNHPDLQNQFECFTSLRKIEARYRAEKSLSDPPN